jgi:flagellar protein FlaF
MMAQDDWQTLPTDQANRNGQGFGQAARAYLAAAAHRSVREQEAEIFRRANAVLRRTRASDGLARVRALADNYRLWSATIDLLSDPGNSLPADLRASIVSIGRAVLREIDGGEPDFDFLISINENIAGGLFDRA